MGAPFLSLGFYGLREKRLPRHPLELFERPQRRGMLSGVTPVPSWKMEGEIC